MRVAAAATTLAAQTNLVTGGGEKWVDEDDEPLRDVLGKFLVEQLGQLLGVRLVPLDQDLPDGHAGLHLADGLQQNITLNFKYFIIIFIDKIVGQ